VAAGDRRCWYASNLLRVGTIAIEPDRLSRLVWHYLDRRLEDGAEVSFILEDHYGSMPLIWTGCSGSSRLDRSGI
jgi:hypothetical protein